MSNRKRQPPPRPARRAKESKAAKPAERQQAPEIPEPPLPPQLPRFRPDPAIKNPRQRAMLTALGRLGIVTHAAAAAKIARAQHYTWLTDDPAYAAEVERAQEWYAGLLEIEAERRAVEGTFKPVVSGGKTITWKHRYSDGLLMFRLKALMPEKYR